MSDEILFNANKKTLKDISHLEKMLINKDDILKIVNKINKDTNEYISLVVDSNFNTTHAKAVSGIIETNLRNNGFEKFHSNYYIPKNLDPEWYDIPVLTIKSAIPNLISNYDEYTLKNNDYYNIFANIDKNKKVFINESFSEHVMFDTEDLLSFDNINSFKSKITKLNKETNDTIEFLNKHPNITIVKAAGNNVYDSNKNQISFQLKKMFDILTSYDYENTKTLVTFFNKIIQDKIDGKTINENYLDFLDTLKKSLTKLNINYDKFIDLYLKDYLVHYEKLSLLKESGKLKNNNLFIVEALNYNKILENYTHYKDYLEKHGNDSKLKNFENDIKLINIKKDQSYDAKNIEDIKKLYTNYKKELPEIFKYSTYGTISNLEYHNEEKYNVFKRSIEGHDSYYKEKPFYGTSAACPEFLSDLIKKIIDYYELEKNIKGLED